MAERHESCRGEVAARGHAGRQEPEPRPETLAGGEFDGPLWTACTRCGLTRIEQHLDARGGADGVYPCQGCGGRGIVQTGCHPLPMASLADAVDGGAAMTTATATRAYRRNQPPRMDVTVSACRACGGEGVQAWAFGAPQESERCLGRANVTVGQVCVECGGGPRG